MECSVVGSLQVQALCFRLQAQAKAFCSEFGFWWVQGLGSLCLSGFRVETRSAWVVLGFRLVLLGWVQGLGSLCLGFRLALSMVCTSVHGTLLVVLSGKYWSPPGSRTGICLYRLTLCMVHSWSYLVVNTGKCGKMCYLVVNTVYYSLQQLTNLCLQLFAVVD